ncbi:MAG: hypothetical protein PSV36_05510 [Algoriphagus sp.]|nr:hypothetical protein [Algoriphagus sp.]
MDDGCFCKPFINTNGKIDNSKWGIDFNNFLRLIKSDILKLYFEGNPEAVLAYELYAYRIKKYIGSYAAILNGLDAIIFTAGVGENDTLSRKLTSMNLEYLGIHLDEAKNEAGGKGLLEINTSDSPVKILVIPTNEELEIANQCFELLENR